MGQYWKPVNLDKRECLDPHALGCGLKLLEQAWTPVGTAQAVMLLLTPMSEPRGGGDFPAGFGEVIGRWAGDRVVWVGDYSEDDDLPDEPYPGFSNIYHLCKSAASPLDPPRWNVGNGWEEAPEDETIWDITPMVVPAMEQIFEGKYVGSGWRNFERGMVVG